MHLLVPRSKLDLENKMMRKNRLHPCPTGAYSPGGETNAIYSHKNIATMIGTIKKTYRGICLS